MNEILASDWNRSAALYELGRRTGEGGRSGGNPFFGLGDVGFNFLSAGWCPWTIVPHYYLRVDRAKVTARPHKDRMGNTDRRNWSVWGSEGSYCDLGVTVR